LPENRNPLDRAVDYLRSWLGYRLSVTGVTGCVLAISRRGELLCNEAFGSADLSTGEAITPAHVFRVASHSKTFTATAVLQLAEQGGLRLDDRVAALVPWLARHRDARMRSVTVREVLSHGAGIVRDGAECDFWQLMEPFPDAARLRQEVLGARLVTEPNVALKYSNIGYSVLGALVEEVTGMPYEDYVTARIVTPLGLGATGPEWEWRSPVAAPAVTGHTRRDARGGRRLVPPVDTRAMAAATGFYSTAEDLCRYFTAHMAGSGQLLSDASKREMQKVHWHVHHPGPGLHEDYGLGLHLETVGQRQTFGHGGGYPGQITRSMADPQSGLVVVVLTNCADGAAGDIARAVFAVIDFFEAHPAPPKPRWEGLEGRYANLWAVRDVVGAGRRLVATAPDSWSPFKQIEELVAGPSTHQWRIDVTTSFGSAGERVTFEHDDEGVSKVRFGGMTMWPEHRWPDVEAELFPPGAAPRPKLRPRR
jgi:D-alanyl-D-alanine carboxypeptidase